MSLQEKLNKASLLVKRWKDFPTPPVIFRDLCPLLENAEAFQACIDDLTTHKPAEKIGAILAIESRGFLLAAPLALAWKVPLVLVRRSHKLPGPIVTEKQTTEYGSGELAIQENSVKGKQVIVVDDVFATGGTLQTARKLIEKGGGLYCGFMGLIYLQYLADKPSGNFYCVWTATSPTEELVLSE